MYTEPKSTHSNKGRYVYLNKFNDHKDEATKRLENLETKMMNMSRQYENLRKELYGFTIILAVTLSFVVVFAFVK